jgi:hypothetical protein
MLGTGADASDATRTASSPSVGLQKRASILRQGSTIRSATTDDFAARGVTRMSIDRSSRVYASQIPSVTEGERAGSV